MSLCFSLLAAAVAVLARRASYCCQPGPGPRGFAAWPLVLLLLLGRPLAAQPAFDYAVVSGHIDERAHQSAPDAAGNTLVAGSFQDSIRFGAVLLSSSGGNSNIYVAKLDPAGRCLWARQAGGTGADFAFDLAVDQAGCAYLTGGLGSSSAQFGAISLSSPGPLGTFVAKIDGAGRWRWARATGSASFTFGQGIALNPQAAVFITGTFGDQTTTFGSTVLVNPAWTAAQSAGQLFVASLDSAGTWQWAVGGGAAVPGVGTTGEAIAADARGKVVVTGTFTGTATFGATTLTSAGSSDVLVAQLHAGTGAWQWVRQAGGTDEDAGLALAVDARGSASVTGTLYSSTAQFGPFVATHAGVANAFVARLSPAGAFQWVHTGGGADEDQGEAIAVGADGASYVAGSYRSAPALYGNSILLNAGGSDLFITKLDSAGSFAWAVRAGSRGFDRVRSLSLAGPADDLLLSGWFESDSARFGPVTVTGNPNAWNGFVARLSAGTVLLRTVSPANGVAGQQVTLTGTRLTGVTDVLFNGQPSPAFTVLSATELRATVPAGAGSGPLSVRTAAGLSGPGPAFQVQGLSRRALLAADAVAVWPVPAPWPVPVHVLAGPGQTGLHYTLRTLQGHALRSGLLPLAPARADLAGLPAGVYLLTVHHPAKGQLTRRVVVQ